TVAGTVKDEQGLPVPGATVTLVSEARGTRMVPVFTGTTGDFVVPNLTPDTYTVEITLEGFHPVRRAGIAVSGADRVNIGALTLTVDAVQEVKILTTSYQAEYGRSAGAQISAVTKSGTQQFHGSFYADRRRDDLDSNTWLNNVRGLPKQKINQSDQGYTVG